MPLDGLNKIAIRSLSFPLRVVAGSLRSTPIRSQSVSLVRVPVTIPNSGEPDFQPVKTRYKDPGLLLFQRTFRETW